MFTVGGFNAYPAEIEALLMHHPAVAQAAVVGRPDAALGEVGWAFVVPRGPADGDEIIEWARGHMSNYKVPRRVFLVDTLPANVNGKVDKRALCTAPRPRPPRPGSCAPIDPDRPPGGPYRAARTAPPVPRRRRRRDRRMPGRPGHGREKAHGRDARTPGGDGARRPRPACQT